MTIGGEEFVRVELGYNLSGQNKKLVVYTSDPQSIDNMINNLVQFQAQEKAKEMLKNLITEKVSQLLNL